MKERYFPHDFGSRSDEKILSLRSDFGMEGYGIFWSLVELLYEHGGKLRISKGLSVELGVDFDMIDKIIKGYGLFVYDDEFFCSESAKKRMKKIEDLSKKRSESGKIGMRKRWGKKSPDRKQDEMKEMRLSIAKKMEMPQVNYKDMKDAEKY